MNKQILIIFVLILLSSLVSAIGTNPIQGYPLDNPYEAVDGWRFSNIIPPTKVMGIRNGGFL